MSGVETSEATGLSRAWGTCLVFQSPRGLVRGPGEGRRLALLALPGCDARLRAMTEPCHVKDDQQNTHVVAFATIRICKLPWTSPTSTERWLDHPTRHFVTDLIPNSCLTSAAVVMLVSDGSEEAGDATPRASPAVE